MPKLTKSVLEKIAKAKLALINELEDNPIIEIACKKAGVSRATYYRWIKDDKDFKYDANYAQKHGVDKVNDAVESTLINLAIKDRSLGAIKFWLENRHPGFRPNKELERGRKLTNDRNEEHKLPFLSEY